jgi:hypothetical protein
LMQLAHLLLGASIPAITLASHAQDTGSVCGVVRDSAGQPVAFARVILDSDRGVVAHDSSLQAHIVYDSLQRTGTDSDGRFLLYGVRAGRHVVRVGRVGFLPFMTDSFDVIAGRRSMVQIVLSSASPREVVLGCGRAVAVYVANLDHRPLVDKPIPDPSGGCRQ